jgi:hypothetical protein
VEYLFNKHEVLDSIPAPSKKKKKKNPKSNQALVAHTCNPSCSGGRDQDDQGLEASPANSSRDSILKKLFTKKGLVKWLKVKALSSSPNTTKKKKIHMGIKG